MACTGLNDRKKRRLLFFCATAGLILVLSGCSRSQINYQVAKAIGTLGMYENNEPVETPRMKAEREFREGEEEKEKELLALISQADVLALAYRYDEAIALLEGEGVDPEDTRVKDAVARYRQASENMYEYDGDIPQLCFPNLITDTNRAFQESGNGSVYKQVMITVSEFENILLSMYQNGYLLIDIHSLMKTVTSEDGVTVSTAVNPVIPKGKKPFILSVENLDYSSVLKNGDGIALRLALNDDGEVKALYTDEGGHDLKGDYDVVPVLETFISQHPDFSYQGARGVIGISGKEGIFGYDVEDDGNTDYSKNRDTVKQIARKLISDGWTIACETYSYDYVKDMSYDALTADITKWKEVVGRLVGETDILMYPYGSEVSSYEDNKGVFLLNEGFRYFLSLWATQDFREVKADYFRMTRRMVNGYIFQDSPNLYDAYFSVSSILDSARAG